MPLVHISSSYPFLSPPPAYILYSENMDDIKILAPRYVHELWDNHDNHVIKFSFMLSANCSVHAALVYDIHNLVLWPQKYTCPCL